MQQSVYDFNRSILLLVIVKKNYKFDSRAYYLFLKEKIEKGKNGRQNGSR